MITKIDPRRGTGRTSQSLLDMPEEGGIFIIHSTAFRDYAKRLAARLRGPEFADKIEFMVIKNRCDVERLRGLRKTIAVDHHWWEVASHDVMRDVYPYIESFGLYPDRLTKA